MEEPVLDVRPEFVPHLGDGVGANLFAQLADIRAHAVIVGIVSVRDRYPGCVSYPLREVESGSSGISARHHHTCESIPGTAPRGAMPPPKVARVLAQQGRIDGFGHHVPYGLIRVAGSQPPPKSGQALTELRMLVGQLSHAGEGTRQQNQWVVKGVLEADGEFLFHADGSVDGRFVGGAVVGEHAEYA